MLIITSTEVYTANIPWNPRSKRREWIDFQEEGLQVTQILATLHLRDHRFTRYISNHTNPDDNSRKTISSLSLPAPQLLRQFSKHCHHCIFLHRIPVEKLSFHLSCRPSQHLGKSTFLPPDSEHPPTKISSELPHISKFLFAVHSNFQDRVCPSIIEASNIWRSFAYVPIFYELGFCPARFKPPGRRPKPIKERR